MTSGFTESVVESAALAWLESLGYRVKHGLEISPAGDTLTLTLSRWEGNGTVRWRRSASTMDG